MLGDEIGKGAYGRVYKGLDLENGDFVAIKQVSLENIAQEDLNVIMVYLHFLANCLRKKKKIVVLIFSTSCVNTSTFCLKTCFCKFSLLSW